MTPTTEHHTRPMLVSLPAEPWTPCPHDGCPYDKGDSCGLMACPGRTVSRLTSDTSSYRSTGAAATVKPPTSLLDSPGAEAPGAF
jgi:hypothetical protein